MKQALTFILTLTATMALAQDTTYYFLGWGKPGVANFAPRDSMEDKQHTQVKYVDDQPVLLKHYDAKNQLQNHVENEYDERGNHLISRTYDNQGTLREELVFRNNPNEMAIFRKIFGSTFNPGNFNFMIQRDYNEWGRETGYYIIGVHGRPVCSREILYREDRRKDREILKDDVNDIVLTERRYKYVDAENRTILEEYNGAGKMVQKVVLFDHHDILEN